MNSSSLSWWLIDLNINHISLVLNLRISSMALNLYRDIRLNLLLLELLPIHFVWKCVLISCVNILRAFFLDRVDIRWLRMLTFYIYMRRVDCGRLGLFCYTIEVIWALIQRNRLITKILPWFLYALTRVVHFYRLLLNCLELALKAYACIVIVAVSKWRSFTRLWSGNWS